MAGTSGASKEYSCVSYSCFASILHTKRQEMDPFPLSSITRHFSLSRPIDTPFSLNLMHSSLLYFSTVTPFFILHSCSSIDLYTPQSLAGTPLAIPAGSGRNLSHASRVNAIRGGEQVSGRAERKRGGFEWMPNTPFAYSTDQPLVCLEPVQSLALT